MRTDLVTIYSQVQSLLHGTLAILSLSMILVSSDVGVLT